MPKMESIFSRQAKKRAAAREKGPMGRITRESDKWRQTHQADLEKKVKLLDLERQLAKTDAEGRKIVEKTVRLLVNGMKESHAHTTLVMKKMRSVMDAPSKKKRTAKSPKR